MVEILKIVCNAIGATVYAVSYPFIWIFWNAAGKYIVVAWKKVVEDSEQDDADSVIKTGADITALRQMLVNAYYNKCYEEATCARSV